MSYRLGVDVGGTFTDVLLVEEGSGATWRAKTASTPADQAVGVLPGIERVCADAGISFGWGGLTLEPGPGEPVVVKQYASAFFGTSLASTLRVAGVDNVVVTGVLTSGCVRATAMDALNHGFRPQVVREACAHRTPELHRNNLTDLDATYADVVGLGDALLHL
jgi:hypothetical protein